MVSPLGRPSVGLRGSLRRPSLAISVAALVLGALGVGSGPVSAQATAVRVLHDPSVDARVTGSPPAPGPRYGPPESVRRRDAALEAAVPPQYAPPSGMCRVWVHGVPPAQQPAPTQCAKAVRVRSPNSQVVFGNSRSTTLASGTGTAPEIIRIGGDRPAVSNGAAVATGGTTVMQAATGHSVLQASGDAEARGGTKERNAARPRVSTGHSNPPVPHVSVHAHR